MTSAILAIQDSKYIESKRLYMLPAERMDFENCVQLYGDSQVVSMYENGKPKSELEALK